VYTIFGCPRLIWSDCDTKFHSEVFQAVQKWRGVTISLGTPYHGRTSGGIEIRIKSLQEHLRIRTDAQGSDWLEELPEALMAVNNTVNEDTTLSPQMILMGYRPTSPIDMLRELVEDDEHHILTAEERLEHYLQQRDDDRRDHCDRLRVDRERQETASKNKTQKTRLALSKTTLLVARLSYIDIPLAHKLSSTVVRATNWNAWKPTDLTTLWNYKTRYRIRVEWRRDWSNQKLTSSRSNMSGGFIVGAHGNLTRFPLNSIWRRHGRTTVNMRLITMFPDLIIADVYIPGQIQRSHRRQIQVITN
jgi:hypothetical protein